MSQVPAGAHNLHHLFGKYTQMLQGDLSPSHWPALIECYERIMTIAPAFCPAYCVLLHAKRRISDQLLAKAVALIRTPHGQTRNRDVDRSAPEELTPQKISCTLPLAPLAALGAKKDTLSVDDFARLRFAFVPVLTLWHTYHSPEAVQLSAAKRDALLLRRVKQLSLIYEKVGYFDPGTAVTPLQHALLFTIACTLHLYDLVTPLVNATGRSIRRWSWSASDASATSLGRFLTALFTKIVLVPDALRTPPTYTDALAVNVSVPPMPKSPYLAVVAAYFARVDITIPERANVFAPLMEQMYHNDAFANAVLASVDDTLLNDYHLQVLSPSYYRKMQYYHGSGRFGSIAAQTWLSRGILSLIRHVPQGLKLDQMLHAAYHNKKPKHACQLFALLLKGNRSMIEQILRHPDGAPLCHLFLDQILLVEDPTNRNICECLPSGDVDLRMVRLELLEGVQLLADFWPELILSRFPLCRAVINTLLHNVDAYIGENSSEQRSYNDDCLYGLLNLFLQHTLRYREQKKERTFKEQSTRTKRQVQLPIRSEHVDELTAQHDEQISKQKQEEVQQAYEKNKELKRELEFHDEVEKSEPEDAYVSCSRKVEIFIARESGLSDRAHVQEVRDTHVSTALGSKGNDNRNLTDQEHDGPFAQLALEAAASERSVPEIARFLEKNIPLLVAKFRCSVNQEIPQHAPLFFCRLHQAYPDPQLRQSIEQLSFTLHPAFALSLGLLSPGLRELTDCTIPSSSLKRDHHMHRATPSDFFMSIINLAELLRLSLTDHTQIGDDMQFILLAQNLHRVVVRLLGFQLAPYRGHSQWTGALRSVLACLARLVVVTTFQLTDRRKILQVLLRDIFFTRLPDLLKTTQNSHHVSAFVISLISNSTAK